MKETKVNVSDFGRSSIFWYRLNIFPTYLLGRFNLRSGLGGVTNH